MLVNNVRQIVRAQLPEEYSSKKSKAYHIHQLSNAVFTYIVLWTARRTNRVIK